MVSPPLQFTPDKTLFPFEPRRFDGAGHGRPMVMFQISPGLRTGRVGRGTRSI